MKTKTLVVTLTAYVVVPDDYSPQPLIAQQLKRVPASIFPKFKIEEVELTYETHCAGPEVQ